VPVRDRPSDRRTRTKRGFSFGAVGGGMRNGLVCIWGRWVLFYWRKVLLVGFLMELFEGMLVLDFIILWEWNWLDSF
jgi:hypothetical protein